MPRRFVKRNKRITKYKKSVSDEVAKEVKGSLISQHYPRKKNQKKNSKKAQHQRGGGIVVVFISSFFFFSSLPGFNQQKKK
jgi:MFS superfamily sulfate permease-like transporter